MDAPLCVPGCYRINEQSLLRCGKPCRARLGNCCSECQTILLASRHKICNLCHQELSFDSFSLNRSGAKNPDLTMEAVTGLHQLLSRCRPCQSKYMGLHHRSSWRPFVLKTRRDAQRNARSRGIEYNGDELSIDYLMSILEQHCEFACHYTAQPLTRVVGDPRLASLERLDPTRGYVVGNVTFCMWALNSSRQWSVDKLRHATIHQTVGDTMPPEYADFVEWVTSLVTSFGTAASKAAVLRQHLRKRFPYLAFLQKRVRACEVATRSRNALQRKRGQPEHYVVEIRVMWFLEQLVKQNFRCAYSNLFLRLEPGADWQLSPDRQDNKIGYTTDDGQVLLICYEFQTTCRWSKQLVEEVFGSPLMRELARLETEAMADDSSKE